MYVCWYPSQYQSSAYPTSPIPPLPYQPSAFPTTPIPLPGLPPLPPPPNGVPLTEVISIDPATTIFPITRTLKRGSDELLSHSSMVTNGTGMSPHHLNSDMSNDAKKVKLDNNDMISRVVHIRSLPLDINEIEVVNLGMPFGKVTNVLLLKQKSQAFLEFADENAAGTMVEYHQGTPAQVRLKQVYVQLSNHKELKTDAAHSIQNASAQAAIHAVQSVMSDDQAKTILRVIVEQMIYPINIEILQWLFSKYGKILKIITFNKNNQYQALIQFSDSVGAKAAKMSLDGQCIYNGCCILKIDYSKLSNLNVKYNNTKSRDYTNPNLPTGDNAPEQGPLFPGPSPSMMTTPFATMPGFGASPLTAYALPNNNTPAGAAFGGMPGMQPSPFHMHNVMGAAAAAAQMGLQVPSVSTGSPVLHVSNLEEQKVSPEALFTLFGVYGDVHRVKILFNKKDSALIQMAEPHQAQLAIGHLDNLRLWGKTLRVIPSKHTNVQLPKEGQQDSGLTKDFTNSILHRFKRPGSKNCQNIFPPSAVLHLSNIPATVQEEDIKDMFEEHGEVKGFRFFPKDRRMALLQMGSIDESVVALMAMHNHDMGNNQSLRVSFSKSAL